MKFQQTFSVLIPSVIAAASLTGDLRAAVVFAIQDSGPALNTTTPPAFIAGTGSVGSSIAAANTTPQITYTVTNLDFTSIGGTASEQVVFTVGFSATGGDVTYNTNGNIYVGPNGDANQIDVGETLTATVNLSSTTFNGNDLSKLSIGFSQMQVTSWASGEAFKVTYSTGNTTITNPTSATYNLPEISNFFTVETTAGSLNLQRYNVEITAVPEPSAMLLGGLGILALLRRRR